VNEIIANPPIDEQINDQKIDKIYINVDDEKGILNMNKKLFSKYQVDLKTIKTGAELIN